MDFRVLEDIRKGDEIVLETEAGQFVYRVTKLEVVAPSDTDALQPVSRAELNLITCYPFYYAARAQTLRGDSGTGAFGAGRSSM